MKMKYKVEILDKGGFVQHYFREKKPELGDLLLLSLLNSALQFLYYI